MNVPLPSKEYVNPEHLAIEFIISQWPSIAILPEEFEDMAKMFLICFNAGALAMADSIKMPVQLKGAALANLQFSVILPPADTESAQTLPTEEKK